MTPLASLVSILVVILVGILVTKGASGVIEGIDLVPSLSIIVVTTKVVAVVTVVVNFLN